MKKTILMVFNLSISIGVIANALLIILNHQTTKLKEKMMLIVFFIFLITACSNIAPVEESNNPVISVKGDKFVDSDDRQIILHGINLVNKNPKVNYLGDEGFAEFAAMRDWGFNCVRLGVIWDGLEPIPGEYDENYLDGIKKQIDWAKQNDLYVILDMHQDLFSVLFSDGAPEWATITNGQPHINDTPVWSDAYFSSPAVQTAWDHFWDNSPGPDGIGIQEHYARAWAHVVKRFAAESTVIGFDIMNEPFLGLEAKQIFPIMLDTGAKLLNSNKDLKAVTAEELGAKWATAEGRNEILQMLSDINLYSQIMDATQPLYNQFEKDKLMPMHQRVANAIRQVDENRILFLATTMGSNMGVYSTIEPVLDKNGNRDLSQAYAPHGYDLVTDTRDVASANLARVQLIFDRHGQTARRLGMPMLVGEWGAYGHHQGTLSAASGVMRQFEKLLCGDTYWDFDKKLPDLDHFKAINHPYPERISGTLIHYDYNATKGVFTCTWLENQAIKQPTRIYIPAWLKFDPEQVEFVPAEDVFEIIPVQPGSSNSWMIIKPSGRNQQRTVSFSTVGKM